MPLLPGKKNIGTNIATEIKFGKKPSQATAIAYSVARENKKNDLLALPLQRVTMQNYGIGTLRDQNQAEVNGPAQAKQLASNRSRQSYSDQVRNFSNHDKFGIRKK